jgi:hypothetical protein
MAVWNIVRKFGIFYDHLVHFVFILYIVSGFGIMYMKSMVTLLSERSPLYSRSLTDLKALAECD